jgi:hypothetical protein
MPSRVFTSRVFDSDPIRPAQPPRAFGLIDIAGVGVTNALSYQIKRALAVGEAQARPVGL